MYFRFECVIPNRNTIFSTTRPPKDKKTNTHKHQLKQKTQIPAKKFALNVATKSIRIYEWIDHSRYLVGVQVYKECFFPIQQRKFFEFLKSDHDFVGGYIRCKVVNGKFSSSKGSVYKEKSRRSDSRDKGCDYSLYDICNEICDDLPFELEDCRREILTLNENMDIIRNNVKSNSDDERKEESDDDTQMLEVNSNGTSPISGGFDSEQNTAEEIGNESNASSSVTNCVLDNMELAREILEEKEQAHDSRNYFNFSNNITERKITLTEQISLQNDDVDKYNILSSVSFFASLSKWGKYNGNTTIPLRVILDYVHDEVMRSSEYFRSFGAITNFAPKDAATSKRLNPIIDKRTELQDVILPITRKLAHTIILFIIDDPNNEIILHDPHIRFSHDKNVE